MDYGKLTLLAYRMTDQLTNGRKRVGTIICYFGPMPWYFNYFLHSCRFNPSIDFYVISDHLVAHTDAPENVTFVKMSIAEFNDLASSKLGIATQVTNGYKVCDFKPMFGLIFNDLLHQYDYWAQSDIDVIYGDLRCFLDDIFDADYDYISVRHDFTTGCFSVFKNNSLVNNLFRKSKDIEKVLSGSTHYCFDECNFVQPLLNAGKSIWEVDTEIYSYTHIIREAEQTGAIKAHFDFLLIEGITGKIKFRNGKLIYNNQFEAMLYHLYMLKRVYTPRTSPKNIPDQFNISPTRIYF